jgi:hypothetical protein
MQEATIGIPIPQLISRLYLHSMQKPNHTSFASLISRFKIHETFQINKSNFLISRNTLIQGL